jgi:aldose 1-epimerase
MTDGVQITHEPFGLLDGKAVALWHVARPTRLGEMAVSVAEYGASLVRCAVPDPAGTPVDVVLGYDRLEDYVFGRGVLGATVGRYANRLRGARLLVDGEPFDLVANEGPNQLHGGPEGFSARVWEGRPSAEGDGVALRLVSPDGDMGFPGRLEAEVVYRILPDGGLAIDMTATTDRPTVCNLVNHAYWNLAGHGSGTVADHVARFGASFYTPVDAEQLATGEVLAVAGTPLDFRAPRAFGTGPDDPAATAFDHNLVLGVRGRDGLRDAAEVSCPQSGLGLALRTSEPGLQLYTAGKLPEGTPGKDGAVYGPGSGFTLETQVFPCAPDFGHFPGAVLRPGEMYRHAMRLSFAHVPREKRG